MMIMWLSKRIRNGKQVWDQCSKTHMIYDHEITYDMNDYALVQVEE